MNCNRARKLFSDCLDEELSGSREQGFKEHLQCCPECRSAWASYETTFLAVRSLPPLVVSDSFETRLRARIREKEGAPLGKTSWWSDFARIPLPVPIGAAGLLFVAIFAYNQFGAVSPSEGTASIAASPERSAPSIVENTRPSFAPNLLMPGNFGQVVDYGIYGPPRREVYQQPRSPHHYLRDRNGAPLHGPTRPYVRSQGRSNIGSQTHPVDTLQTR